MPVIILLFLLLILDQRIESVGAQSNISIALPLAVRSPYLSYWLPYLNRSDSSNATNHARLSTTVTTSNLSQVWFFLRDYFDLTSSLILDTRLGCLCSCRRHDICSNWDTLTIPRSVAVTSNELDYHQYSKNAYPDHIYCGSWSHASKSYLHEPCRGSFLIRESSDSSDTSRLTYTCPTGTFKPGNWVKQSIPFSYLSFTPRSLDNSAHNVQVCTDIGPISGSTWNNRGLC
jgi:hypothetical protein